MPRDNFTMSENSGSFGMQQRQDRFDAIGDLIVGPPGPPGPPGEDAPDDYILVQTTQPTSETNAIWVDPSDETEVVLATWDDLNAALEYNELHDTAYATKLMNINETTGRTAANSNCRTVIFNCQPNTFYRVTKTPGARFSVAYTDVEPAANIYLRGVTSNHEGGSIIIQTDSTATFLCVYCYFANYDTEITAAEMCASVGIAVYSAKQMSSSAQFALTYDDRKIYGTAPYAFYSHPTVANNIGSLQTIVKTDDGIFVFTSTGKMLRIAPNGTKVTTSNLPLGHPHYAEILSNGNVLISTTLDEGTANETRSVVEFSLSTNAVVSSFTPTVPGNLVAAAVTGENSYALISWIDNSYKLHFYSYDKTTDVATEISSLNLPRTLFNGAFHHGDFWYLQANDGYNPSRTSMVLAYNASTGEVVDKLYLEGFNETEGFFVDCEESGEMLAYFCDNGNKKVYVVRLK